MERVCRCVKRGISLWKIWSRMASARDPVERVAMKCEQCLEVCPGLRMRAEGRDMDVWAPRSDETLGRGALEVCEGYASDPEIICRS